MWGSNKLKSKEQSGPGGNLFLRSERSWYILVHLLVCYWPPPTCGIADVFKSKSNAVANNEHVKYTG